jgi:hypothetical protein
MKMPNVLIVLAALAVSASLGIRHWAMDTVTDSNDASRESSRSPAPVRGAAPPAVARILSDTAGSAAMPSILGTAPTEEVRGVNAALDAPAVAASPAPDSTGTPDAPGDPEAQPENPSEQFMHSRRGDGQHQE